MLIKCKGKNCPNYFEKRTIDKRDKNKFCSNTCTLTRLRTKKHQKEAGKKAGQVIIAKYRGTGTKTYVKENGRHQHRVVMEQILGRKLRKGEIVHHKDHNKKNNSPENLEVMTQSEHARLHYNPENIKKLAVFNTKYGPLCAYRGCKLPNIKGRPGCAKHRSQLTK